MINHCGACSMCCKYMAIPLLGKEDGQMCRFCDKPNGCTIYKDRPEVCQTFKCLWLETQEMGHALPPELRPDRCKVMIAGTTRQDCIMVYVDKQKPDAWKRDDVMQLIAKLVMLNVYAIVKIGVTDKARFFYRQEGAVHHRWVKMGPPDAEGTSYVVSDLSFLSNRKL